MPRTSFGVPRREAALGSGRSGFALLLLLMAVDYARPQELVAPLQGVPLGVLMALPLLLLLLGSPSRLEPLERVLLPYGLLLVFAAVWVPLALNNFWAFQTWKTLAMYAAVLLGFVAFVTTPERLRWAVRAWILFLVFQAVYGLAMEGRGSGAYFADENDYAMAMALGLALVAFALQAERSLAMRLLLLAAATACAAGIVVSASRGGFVGLAATGAAIIALARHRVRLGLLALAGAVLIALLAPASYWDEMATMFDPNAPTRVERIRHWETGLAMFADRPLFGVGPGNAPWQFANYEVYDTLRERSLAGRALHSAWFTLLAELGLLGLALYGWILALAVRAGLRARRLGSRTTALFASAFLTGGVAWVVCGAFLSILYYPHAYYLLGGVVAAERIARGEAAGGTSS